MAEGKGEEAKREGISVEFLIVIKARAVLSARKLES